MPTSVIIGCAVRQDALVGGGHVGMRSEDNADSAVEVPAHGDLFAGGLGVHVHDDDLHVPGKLAKHLIRRAEGAIGHRLHEQSPQERDDRHLGTGPGLIDGHGPPNGCGRQIRRPDDAIRLLQQRDDLLPTVDVVAHSDQIHAVATQFVVELWGQTGTAGDVLRVGDDAVKIVLLDEVRQGLRNRETPGRPTTSPIQRRLICISRTF
jgi:hypothetical protein